MVRQYECAIGSLALAFLFSFAVATSLELRNPGDTLWSQCKNITYNGISLPNSCIVLKEAEDCALNVAVSISGNTILSQNMDLSVVPSVCGTYYGCDICVEINPNPNNANQRCVQIQPTCSGFSPPATTVGCFPNSVLADLLTCESSKCPNNCNGHGTCSQGSCTCTEGWYGDDCNTTGALFDACQQVDALGASICVRLDFEECNIVTQVVIEGNGQELKVFNEPYPVEDFKTVFQQDQCVDVGVCSICLEWDDLVLTEVQASGCGTINLDCLGTQYAYPLGCFQDDTVVPKCFGTCPNNCSYNGYCYRGICQCTEHYTGKDCSVRTYPPCQPADCNKHGVCVMGQCKCDEHWGNADCNTYLSNKSSHESSKATSLMVILVPIFLIVAIAIAAVIIYLVKRKGKRAEHKFTQLELVDDEEDNGLVNSTDEN